MSVDQSTATTPAPPAPPQAAEQAPEVQTFTIADDAPEAPSTPVSAPVTVPSTDTTESYEEPADPSPGEEIERLVPSPGEPFELSDGTKVVANELRLREFLGLLKIVTRGAALAMNEVRLNTNDDDFAQSLISLFIFAIPEAEDEAADFVRMMVRPAGPFDDAKDEAAARTALDEHMVNPDLEDLFSIIEIVITNEGKDLRRLGKRLGKALEFAQKTGQV